MRSILLGAVLALFGAFSTVASAQESDTPQVPRFTQVQIQRGEYIVKMVGCADCHTPMKLGERGPEPDFSRWLSGHPDFMPVGEAPQTGQAWLMNVAWPGTAFAGPWGISFAANLTPDRETGLGEWTAQNFVDTIRNGKHQGNGRAILPPMPWNWIRTATDEDLVSMFAYLTTIPAIRNRVPAPRDPQE